MIGTDQPPTRIDERRTGRSRVAPMGSVPRHDVTFKHFTDDLRQLVIRRQQGREGRDRRVARAALRMIREVVEQNARRDLVDRHQMGLGTRMAIGCMVASPAGGGAGNRAVLGLRVDQIQRQVSHAMIQRIIVPNIRPPVSHYCHVTRAGPHVWVAGIVGQAQDGSIPADVVAQFDIAITVMDKCLKAAGAGAEHVVKVQVFMTDITERPKINPRRIAYFGNNLPVSTLVEVKGLVDPRMKVEIECQAYVE